MAKKSSSSIVAACDGSDQSLEAVKVAGELAEALGAPLKVLCVFPNDRAETMIIGGVDRKAIDAAREEYGRKVFASAREALGGKGGEPEEVLLKGDTAHEIVGYMESNPGTHLVVGRRGYSPLRSLTLGSISEKVVRHAPGPVTVVGQ